MTGSFVKIWYHVYNPKGSAIANHLAENAIDDYEPLKFSFPNKNVMALSTDSEDKEPNDKGKMYFDGQLIYIEML